MLCYLMIVDGEMSIIPLSVDLKTFTHVTVRNRRLGRSLLLKKLHYHTINGIDTPVFILSEAELSNTDQIK
jgi:hypothetical protein